MNDVFSSKSFRLPFCSDDQVYIYKLLKGPKSCFAGSHIAGEVFCFCCFYSYKSYMNVIAISPRNFLVVKEGVYSYHHNSDFFTILFNFCEISVNKYSWWYQRCNKIYPAIKRFIIQIRVTNIAK